MLTGHLNYKDTTNYQFIYATFFKGNYCLYLRLDVNGNDELESIDLYLENYRGSRKLRPNDLIVRFNNGILRIGFETQSGRPVNQPINIQTKSMQINKNNLKAIFVTRNQKHFSRLENHTRNNLINFTNEINNEGNRVFWQYFDKTNISEEELILAVGRNCFTSYIKVNEI